MKSHKLYSVLILGVCSFFFLGKGGIFQKNSVYVVPQFPTPESSTVEVKILFPKEGQNKNKLPVELNMRIEGYPLGTYSQFERAKELYAFPEGQSIHVQIDDNPYLVLNQSFEDSFDENRSFYDKILSYQIQNLTKGEHVIRAFPVRSFGESLKDPGAFICRIFYFQDEEKKHTLNFDPKKPYLTYNLPQGKYPENQANPLLLDFYLSNCLLSTDGYKVKLLVDGKQIAILTNWLPYYLYGLKKGKHTLELQLLDHQNQIVPGMFNTPKSVIEIL